MAGDWIKVRCDLQTHPKVVRILSAMRPHDVETRTDKFRVIGGLHAVWTVFDQHTTDGRLPGYTPEMMDHVIGWDGFSDAMIAVGWLETEGPETLVMPEFTEHNGKSAKRRAEDQKRKRDSRRQSEGCPQSVRKSSAEKRTREEKRREVKEQGAKTHPCRFEDFWETYPTKREKKKAREAWKRHKLDARADQIIADVEKRQRLDEQWLRGYIPHPTTYINGHRWEDEIETGGLRAVDPVPPSQRYLS